MAESARGGVLLWTMVMDSLLKRAQLKWLLHPRLLAGKFNNILCEHSYGDTELVLFTNKHKFQTTWFLQN